MPNVDSLEIQITAEAKRANAALDSLVNKLGKVSASLSGVNGSGIATMSTGVNKLANAVANFSNSTKTADFSRIARNLNSLGNIDGAAVSRASASIRNLASSMQVLDTIHVSDNSKQLADLAKGISQLGYSSSTKAIENIPKLAVAMRELMNELSKAPKVSQNLIDMTNALAKLARTGSSSGKAAKSLGDSLNFFSKSTVKARSSSMSLASAIGKLYATYWVLFRAFGKLGEAINISSSLTEVQNVVDTTFGAYKGMVEDMAKTSITDFGMSELTVKQVSSRFQAMGSAMGFTQGKMADMSIELTKLTADMASFYNLEQTDVAEDLQSVFTGQTRPLRAYGLDLTEATLKEWAMKQGMDANIDSMSQMEKTMLRYQYVMANTTAAQGDFLKTQDTWANQVRILKQNLEQLAIVIGKTLINALKPLVSALNAAMTHIIAFAQTVSDALGKIFGWKYEVGSGGIATDIEDGEDAAGGLSDGLGNAVDNAKKLKQQLQGIDELNVISSDTGADSGGSGGASGGGGGASGQANGGQWVEQEKLFESSIDSLYELGEYIGKTLTNAMNSIDWDKTYQSAKNWGKGLADFLNGLISPDLFGAVGRTIAGSLNTALYFLNSFGKTFDWKDFGLSLATGINEFFKTFDFKNAADTINVWLKGVLTTVSTFLKETDFEMIGQKIGEFLRTLDLSGITSAVAENIWLALKSSFQLLKGMIKEAPFETALVSAFALFKYTKLGSIVATKVSTTLATYLAAKLGLEGTFTSVGAVFTKAIGTALTTALTSVGGIGGLLTTDIGVILGSGSAAGIGLLVGSSIIGGIVAAIGGFQLGQWLNEVITGEEIDMSWAEQFKEIKNSFTDGSWKQALSLWGKDITEGLKEIGIRIGNELFNWNTTFSLFDIAGDFFSDISSAFKEKDWKRIGSDIINGIISGLLGALSFITEPISDLFIAIYDGICSVFGIHSPAKEMKPLGKNIILGVVEGFKQAYADLKNKLVEIKDTIVEKFTEIKEKIEEIIGKVKETISTKFEEIKKSISDKISSVYTTVRTYFSNIYSNISSTVTNISTTVRDKFEEIKTNISTKLSSIVTTVKEKFTEIYNKIKGSISDAYDSVKDYFDKIKDKIEKVMSSAKNAVNDFKDAISETITKIGDFFKQSGKEFKITLPTKIFSDFLTTVSNVVDKIKNLFDYNGKTVTVNTNTGGTTAATKANGGLFSAGKWKPITQYAGGGLPNQGQMFIAREAGPELVGTIRGNTAVVNNDQIVASVASGVYNAVVSALNNYSGSTQVNVSLEGDANGLFRVMQKEAYRYQTRTGNPAFI